MESEQETGRLRGHVIPHRTGWLPTPRQVARECRSFRKSLTMPGHPGGRIGQFRRSEARGTAIPHTLSFRNEVEESLAADPQIGKTPVVEDPLVLRDQEISSRFAPMPLTGQALWSRSLSRRKARDRPDGMTIADRQTTQGEHNGPHSLSRFATVYWLRRYGDMGGEHSSRCCLTHEKGRKRWLVSES